MKFAICARILLGATAWLVASESWADQGAGDLVFVNARNPSTSSAAILNAERNSHNASLLAENDPEDVAAPTAAEESDAIQSGPNTVQGESILGEAGEGFCDDCCSLGPMQRGMWYASVDYLLLRPRISQNVAEVRRHVVSNSDVIPNTLTYTDDSVEFNFPYQSGFRASLGYRLLDCGGDIQVTYWRMSASASFHNDGPVVTGTDDDLLLFAQLKNNPGPGGFLSGSAGVTANIFDVDFAKCISMGGPQGECDACFCPRWDLRWSAGARIADISRFDNNTATTPSTATELPTDTITTGSIDARFVGAGPRIGVQGRRYFGCNGFLSLYAKASQALLIGDFRMRRETTSPGDEQIQTATFIQNDRYSRMIPVTDIEVGGSWQIAPYTFVSAGYFFQCWWDLGFGETVLGTNFGPLDTANILGFDGLFVRGEIIF
jgi:hypothetical protein